MTKADAGYYTCRVSTPERSYSFHKRVFVGTKPKFINPSAETTVEYEEDAAALFDCQATGDPPPTVSNYSPAKENLLMNKIKNHAIPYFFTIIYINENIILLTSIEIAV